MIRDATLGEWIHVNERTPKCNRKRESFGTPVLVFSVGGREGRHVFEAFYGKRHTAAPNFYIYGVVMHDISHWMPLPKGPQ